MRTLALFALAATISCTPAVDESVDQEQARNNGEFASGEEQYSGEDQKQAPAGQQTADGSADFSTSGEAIGKPGEPGYKPGRNNNGGNNGNAASGSNGSGGRSPGPGQNGDNKDVTRSSSDSSGNSSQDDKTTTTVGSSQGGESSDGGQCRRVGFGLTSGGGGLGLVADDASDSLAPLTVTTKLTWHDKDDQSLMTNTCTGFLINTKQPFGQVDANGKGQSTEPTTLMLPRISIPGHCLRLPVDKNDKKVAGAKLKFVEIQLVSDASQKAQYSVDSNGDMLLLHGGKNLAAPWHIPLDQIGKEQVANDQCSLDKDNDFADDQGLAKARGIACFTPTEDRLHIITKVEAKALTQKSGILPGLQRPILKKLLRDGILAQYETEFSGIKWQEHFKNKRSRYIGSVAQKRKLDFNLKRDFAFRKFQPKNEKEAYEVLGKRLRRVLIVSSIVHNESEQPPLESLEPKPIKNDDGEVIGKSWEGILKIYGENSVGYSNGQSFDYWKINSIGIEKKYHDLWKGHSGTLMVGEWYQTTAPLLSVYKYRQLLGILSTVGRVPVCLGDDLTCCEKVK